LYIKLELIFVGQ